MKDVCACRVILNSDPAGLVFVSECLLALSIHCRVRVYSLNTSYLIRWNQNQAIPKALWEAHLLDRHVQDFYGIYRTASDRVE
jgi:hypothetical protein